MDKEVELERLEQLMKQRELGDDGYYLSHQYEKDCHKRYCLKKAIRERDKNKPHLS